MPKTSTQLGISDDSITNIAFTHPFWVGRVVSHDLAEKNVSNRRTSHWRAGVAAVGLFNLHNVDV